MFMKCYLHARYIWSYVYFHISWIRSKCKQRRHIRQMELIILTSKFSSYVIDPIINWCVHEWRNYNNILHMFPNNLCCGYILYGSLLFQLTIWYDVSKVFWHIFFLFLTVFSGLHWYVQWFLTLHALKADHATKYLTLLGFI